jgi:hypothetical protein
MGIIQNRFETGNFICFAYKEKGTNRLAYARWLCTKQFFSEVLKKELLFAENEALTLDSFTHPDFRKLGLHRNMNILMLQWIKRHTSIQYVFLVIKCFIPHLTKYPQQLGYKSIESVFYYKTGSISFACRKMIKKVI